MGSIEVDINLFRLLWKLAKSRGCEAILFILILTHCLHFCDGLAINNGVVGQPQVVCSEDSIRLSVRTQELFRGNIYIKGSYNLPTCRQEYFNNAYNGASYTVGIGQCGMRRIRQLQPGGINYALVFVVNFHPQFVTKVDRAYNVRCFYAQADKTVTSNLEVSMLSTQSIEDQTMLMPNCEYSVRSGSLNGPRIRYARVGDQLFHRWECDNPNYGMLVKNCVVNDGAGTQIRVLDSRGCPVFTPVIQGNLQYDSSLNLAYAEIWAYKFPDRSGLFFQCQIQICNKRDNECLGVTPPNCPIVLKSDFQPNSVLDTSVDPNRVVAQGFRSSNTNPSNPSFVPYQPGALGYDSPSPTQRRLAERRRLVELENRDLPIAQKQTDSESESRQRVPDDANRETEKPPQLLPIGLRGLVPARVYRGGQNTEKIVAQQQSSRKRRTAFRHGEQSATATGRNQNPNALVEDDEDESLTLDVTSEMVYVADVGQNTEDEDASDHTRSPFAHGRTGDASVCFNSMGVGLLLGCFSLCVILTCALLFYVLTTRSKKSKSLLFRRGSSASSANQQPSTVSTSQSSGSLFQQFGRKKNDASRLDDSDWMPMTSHSTTSGGGLPRLFKRVKVDNVF